MTRVTIVQCTKVILIHWQRCAFRLITMKRLVDVFVLNVQRNGRKQREEKNACRKGQSSVANKKGIKKIYINEMK